MEDKIVVKTELDISDIIEKYDTVVYKAGDEVFYIIHIADEYLINLLKLMDVEFIPSSYLAKILICNVSDWYTTEDTMDKLVYESLIAQYAHDSYLYATETLHDRFYIGEDVIMKSNFALLYAVNIIKGRWLEAEPFIYESTYASQYDHWVKKPDYRRKGGF